MVGAALPALELAAGVSFAAEQEAIEAARARTTTAPKTALVMVRMSVKLASPGCHSNCRSNLGGYCQAKALGQVQPVRCERRPIRLRPIGQVENSSASAPGAAYAPISKATPTSPDDPDVWRVRYDTIDRDGKISLRHCGRILHLGIGRAHTRVETICLIHNNEATISTRDTGEILAEFTLDPTRGYQRKNG